MSVSPSPNRLASVLGPSQPSPALSGLLRPRSPQPRGPPAPGLGAHCSGDLPQSPSGLWESSCSLSPLFPTPRPRSGPGSGGGESYPGDDRAGTCTIARNAQLCLKWSWGCGRSGLWVGLASSEGFRWKGLRLSQLVAQHRAVCRVLWCVWFGLVPDREHMARSILPCATHGFISVFTGKFSKPNIVRQARR